MRNIGNLKPRVQSLPRVPAAREVAHFLSKLAGTIRIVTTLFMARTFGKYVHTIGSAAWSVAWSAAESAAWSAQKSLLDEMVLAALKKPKRKRKSLICC